MRTNQYIILIIVKWNLSLQISQLMIAIQFNAEQLVCVFLANSICITSCVCQSSAIMLYAPKK